MSWEERTLIKPTIFKRPHCVQATVQLQAILQNLSWFIRKSMSRNSWGNVRVSMTLEESEKYWLSRFWKGCAVDSNIPITMIGRTNILSISRLSVYRTQWWSPLIIGSLLVPSIFLLSMIQYGRYRSTWTGNLRRESRLQTTGITLAVVVTTRPLKKSIPGTHK